MVKAPDFIPTADSLELPARMDPTKAGIIDAFIALLISGLGVLILTPLMGIATIQQGFTWALTSLIGGLRTFTVSIIEAFFAPFITFVNCNELTNECTLAIVGTREANLLVATGGILGFVLSIVVMGAMMYVFAVFANKVVSAIV